MKPLAFFILLYSTSLHAALTCTGDSYGIPSKYTFIDIPNTNNIQVKKELDMPGEGFVLLGEGIAVHTSTELSDWGSGLIEGDSYYYFVADKESYTELINIVADQTVMTRARPMEGSTHGNFVEHKCTGKF